MTAPAAPAFDAEQVHNAAVIVAEAKRLGLGVRGAEIGVMTADTESDLRNLPGGDRDSAGLFQQRPSQGWGTYRQVTDPVRATDTFFARLARVSGWAKIAPWLAAQRVQVSAFEDGSNYRQDWAAAKSLADQLYGLPAGQVPGGATAGAVPATSTTAPAGLITDATSGAVHALTVFGLKATFLVGGVALVVLGLAKAAEPAARRAAGAAAAATPVGRAAAVAL